MKTTIDEFKHKLKGLPKKEKLLIIEQELINRKASRVTPPIAANSIISSNPKKKVIEYLPTDEQLKKLLKEIEDNDEAYESETRRRELISFMYDRDLNWFFNAKNIPAQQELVMPTYEYFNEGPGKGIFEPLDFFNLLEKQKKDLVKNIDRPFDILNNLKAIPLTERERHTLFGFIIKWFGGYPVNNSVEQYNTVLKLIEKEFLAFQEHTPEKEFCGKDLQTERQFKEVAAHLSAVMPGVKVIAPNEPQVRTKYSFSESHYINKVSFDFEDLPSYVIQRAIVWRFENARLFKDEEYYVWQQKLVDFLNSIPNDYRLKAITKGVEYGKKVYRYHLDNECNNPQNCELNQSWERRIALAEDILMSAKRDIEPKPAIEPELANEKNKEFTTARQVLALHFIFEQLQVRSGEIDRSVKAKFVEFLTGKNYKNIYDALESPFVTKDKNFRFDDLKYLRNYFETLGLSEIVKAINNQLEKPK